MNRKNLHWGGVALLAGLSLGLAGCLSDSDSNGGAGETGTMSLAITDAPSDYADAVNLLIRAVEFKPASGNSVTYEIEEPEFINLLDFQGADAHWLVEEVELPAGRYEWIRLHFNGDGVSTDEASIEINENPGPYPVGIHPLRVPSSEQTGLKLVRGFTVPAGGEASFTIDLDLRKAIHMTGNERFMMRPTFRLIDNVTVAHIHGDVERSLTEYPQCFNEEAGSTPWGSGVYLYHGHGAEPLPISADAPAEEGGPITTATVPLDYEGDPIPFTIGFVAPGEYTVAFTCQAGRDSAVDEEGNLVDPSVDGEPEFHPVTMDVTVNDDAVVTPEHVEFRDEI